MTTLFGPILAAALLAQIPSATLEGKVVDDDGRPVADAQVVLYSPPGLSGSREPLDAHARTDGQGRFVVGAVIQGHVLRADVWAFQRGLAIAAVTYRGREPYLLGLRKCDPRVVTVTDPDGKPVAGARVAPRVLFLGAGDTPATVPPTLAETLGVTTDADGTARIEYLRARDQLVGVRITADAIGTQDLVIIERPFERAPQPAVAVRLKKTSRLAGKVVDQDGRGIPLLDVEVWSHGVIGPANPSRIDFKSGPVRTSADGSFQTPEVLMAGSSYRVTVARADSEPVSSDWITMTETPVTLAPLELRALRTIAGRVLDRQGKPVSDAEVFSSGDGAKRPSSKTDAAGRFSLGGVRRGPAFIFARAFGFRFHGQLLRPAEGEIGMELTRTSERPALALKKLPDPIPLAESRALARGLLDPWWKAAEERGDDNARASLLRVMAPADPTGALERLATAKIPAGNSRSRIQGVAALALAETDVDEGAAVAESMTDVGMRAGTFARLADRVPAAERDRKLVLLRRAATHAEATIDPTDRIRWLGDVAVRLHEVSEADTAKAHFAEGARLAHEFKSQSLWGTSFTGRLAQVDLPEALALAKSRAGERLYTRIVAGVAFHLAWDQPAQVRRFLDQCPVETARDWLIPSVIWKIATFDPTRAQKLLDSLPADSRSVELELCLALGAKERDETASRQAVGAAMRTLDRLMQETPTRSAQPVFALLPLAEAIDPALVPELLWRALALSSSPAFARYLAWYDRDLAAVIFEPARQRLQTGTAQDSAETVVLFEAWALFDPRAAAARLGQIPISSVSPNDNRGRMSVIEALSRAHAERWRRIWAQWEPIFNPLDRDILPDRF
jgi:hypothetical protein